MKTRRVAAFALCLALCISLCSCGFIGPIETEAPNVSFPPLIVHTQDPNATEEPRASQSSEDLSGPDDPAVSTEEPEDPDAPAATVDPEALVYDPNYKLDIEIPELIDGLELPVNGATGFASIQLPIWAAYPGSDSTKKLSTSEYNPTGAPAVSSLSTESSGSTGSAGNANLAASTPKTKFSTMQSQSQNVSAFFGAAAVAMPGDGFQIMEERGDWWYVLYVNTHGSSYGDDTVMGWIEHRYCFINLPDVIPSIIYNDTNSYSSIFKTSYKEIPGITGMALYHSLEYNSRLSKEEYIMPMLYAAARDVCEAQHKALAEGNCLEIYQTFRPAETQVQVAQAVAALAKVDAEVKAGISTSPWSISWFIATGVSNHQIGFALDTSMVRVDTAQLTPVGDYNYVEVLTYSRYTMPTPMHELSKAAASTVSPTSSKLAPAMAANEPAKAMRSYFTTSGFSPLASEWWHFNNNTARKATVSHPSDGHYFTENCYSYLPE